MHRAGRIGLAAVMAAVVASWTIGAGTGTAG
jgi:hypothetical protein